MAVTMTAASDSFGARPPARSTLAEDRGSVADMGLTAATRRGHDGRHDRLSSRRGRHHLVRERRRCHRRGLPARSSGARHQPPRRSGGCSSLSLGLLMADEVQLTRSRSWRRRTRAPVEGRRTCRQRRTWRRHRLVDLSHPIRAGMVTLPGLPGPEITPHLTREASKAGLRRRHDVRDRADLDGGQHRDLRRSPNHRFADGVDLAGLPLGALAELARRRRAAAGAAAGGVDAGDAGGVRRPRSSGAAAYRRQ